MIFAAAPRRCPSQLLHPIAVLALALWVAALPRSAVALSAEQITESTAAQLLIGGTDAIGGIGDWYLANDVVEVIVDDPIRAHAKQNHGGTIVDVGRIDRRDEDQFGRLFTIINMSQQVAPGFDTIRAEVDPAGAWARVVVSSSKGPEVALRGDWTEDINPTIPDPAAVRDVYVETEYRVVPGEPFVHMTTLFRNDGDRPAPIFSYGDIWMRGGRSMRAFAGNTQNLGSAAGFHHTGFEGTSLANARDSIRPFDHVVVPGMRHYTPIGYAVFSPERIVRNLVHFGVTSQHISLLNAFLGDPGWTELSLMRMLEATQRELESGESWTFRRRLLVTGRNDVASATDVIFPLVGLADGTAGIQGWVEPPGVACSIQVDAADTGAPLTQIMVETLGPGAGRYRATLPPGRYRLTLRAPHRQSRTLEATVVPGRFTELEPQRLPEPAWLLFDPEAFTEGPGRIIVSGIRGSSDPVFAAELLDFRIDGAAAESGSETNEIHFLGNGHDSVNRRVAIAPGHYRLTATRGLEYEIAQVEVELPDPGSQAEVPPFALRRVAEPVGFVSADLHVHAQASDDSGISNLARLRSFVADGVDVMVSTDHDHIGNFAPALDALALRDRIVVIAGVEVTSSTGSQAAPYTIGHQNAWPIPYRPFAHRGGAPPSQNLPLAELYAALRRDYGAQVVQLNHPRPREEGGENPAGNFWSHMGSVGEPFDSSLPLDVAPNDALLATASDGRTRGIDFDAVELMNGQSRVPYERVRDDWHSLLRQGYVRSATANSDTHGPSEIAGYPRNYVRVGREGSDFDARAFNAAIRSGRLFGTNGPLITRFRVGGARMGDVVTAPQGSVKVDFEVRAASWVPVDEVRLLVSGEVERLFPLAADAGALRFTKSVDLDLERDAFITLEVGAPIGVDQDAWIAEHPGPYTDVVAPGFVTTAFANPIFVDVDGNGRYDAPGLQTGPPGVDPVFVGVAFLAVVWWIRRRRASG